MKLSVNSGSRNMPVAYRHKSRGTIYFIGNSGDGGGCLTISKDGGVVFVKACYRHEVFPEFAYTPLYPTDQIVITL